MIGHDFRRTVKLVAWVKERYPHIWADWQASGKETVMIFWSWFYYHHKELLNMFHKTIE